MVVMSEQNRKQTNKSRSKDIKDIKDINSIKEKLEECRKERDEYLKGWQRAKADFLNYKKQEGERLESFLNSVKKECILKVLDVYDNFERALENVPKELLENEWVRGVIEVQKQFEHFFNEQGVKAIKAQGERFDPQLHEAVEQVETEDTDTGMVKEVVQKGYLIKGRLLRPAKVKVAM